MQYISRILTGTEEHFKPTKSSLNTPRLDGISDEGIDTDQYHHIFTFIKNQTFENNKGLDTRVCKLIITLLLLGIEKSEIAFIFNISFYDLNKHIAFAKSYLKQEYNTYN